MDQGGFSESCLQIPALGLTYIDPIELYSVLSSATKCFLKSESPTRLTALCNTRGFSFYTGAA